MRQLLLAVFRGASSRVVEPVGVLVSDLMSLWNANAVGPTRLPSALQESWSGVPFPGVG